MSPALKALDEPEKSRVVEEKTPDWVNPMLATLTHDHFDDSDWIYERKLDGQRCLIFKDGDGVKIYSRNQNLLNDKYPELLDALEQAASESYVADGEIVVMEDGVSNFAALQPRMHSSQPDLSIPVHLYLFDLLHFDGHKLTELPTRTRKKLLKSSLNFQDPLRYTQHRNESGLAYLEHACRKNWEGLIAKDAEAPYRHSRSKKWLKFKCDNRQEFVVCGFTEPSGSRVGFGALLVGVYEDDKLRYCGRVGTGFDDDFLESFRETLVQIEDECPIDLGKPGDEAIHWVKPEKVVEVSFTEWTSEWKLRHPSFIGLRNDKNATDVVREGA